MISKRLAISTLASALLIVFFSQNFYAGGKMKIFDAKQDKLLEVFPVNRSDSDWKRLLTPEQYRITTQKGTEAPFTCGLAKIEQGTYKCVRCGTDLFVGAAKFESGTGWPSFYEPVSKHNIVTKDDTTHGMTRTEVLCARCGAHLGHVFSDGPAPTGLRYCINGGAVKLSMHSGLREY